MLVRQYLQWMATAPEGKRVEAVWPFVKAFFTLDLDDDEREAMEAALTVLLDDDSREVRRALAEALAPHAAAPRHLVISLIHDHPDVARIVLARSPVVTDGELIDAVATGTEGMQLAIARRPRISPALSAAICEVAARDAVLALLANDGASVAAISFRRIAERFGVEEPVRRALFARKDLPITVRQSLIRILTVELGLQARRETTMPEKRVEAMVRDACDKATVALLDGAAEADLHALVEHLRMSGQLTTSLLIRAICAGHIRFIEASLASLSGLPAPRVYSILVEGREASLRALFEKSQLPERSHPAFIAALETWRDLDYDGRPGDEYRFSRRMIERILTRYQDFSHSDLDDLLTMLRRLAADAAREAARSVAARVVREESVVHLAAPAPRLRAQQGEADDEAGEGDDVDLEVDLRAERAA
jgi:Uncharacterized protein conserved in bacteria